MTSHTATAPTEASTARAMAARRVQRHANARARAHREAVRAVLDWAGVTTPAEETLEPARFIRGPDGSLARMGRPVAVLGLLVLLACDRGSAAPSAAAVPEAGAAPVAVGKAAAIAHGG